MNNIKVTCLLWALGSFPFMAITNPIPVCWYLALYPIETTCVVLLVGYMWKFLLEKARVLFTEVMHTV